MYVKQYFLGSVSFFYVDYFSTMPKLSFIIIEKEQNKKFINYCESSKFQNGSFHTKFGNFWNRAKRFYLSNHR